MTGLIDEAARHWWAWVAPMFWQVALLIALVGLIDVALRRRLWPQVLYALWLLVLVRLVLPPALSSPVSLTAGVSALGPPERPAAHRVEIARRFPEAALDSRVAVHTPTQSGPSAPVAVRPGADMARVPTLSWRVILMGVWFCGAVILGGWAVARFRRLRRDFRPPAGPDSHGDLLAALAAKLKMRRVPALAFSSRVSSAAVFGVFRPIVVLPEQYRREPPGGSVRYALLHELAHVRRGDLWLHAVFMVVQILYWFHPLLWWVRRRMQQTRELCCDATVAGVLKEETQAYRETLLEAAERLVNRSPLTAPKGLGFLGLIERPGDLLSRLRWLEKDTGRRRRLRTAAAAVAVLAVGATVLPMGRSEAKTATSAEHETTGAPAADRTVRFPDDRSMGLLYTRDRGANSTAWSDWSELAAARGTVTVPAGKDLVLRTRNEGRKGLAPLARLKPDDLQVLDLSTPQSFRELKFGVTNPLPRGELLHLRGLRGLKELILSRTGIDDDGLANLEGLTALRRLTLSQNPIRGAGLSRLANLKSLRYLDLSFTAVSASGLAHLKALPALEELVLNWCPVHDNDLPALQPLGNLKRLSLFRTYITDAGLIHLRDLTQLEDLTLSNHFEITTSGVGRPITGEGLVHLEGMRSLRRLWLSGTSVQGKNLAPLQKLTTLEELSLEEAPVGDEGLRHVARLPRLKHLRVGNTGITDSGLAHLADLTTLEILNLNGNAITDAGLVHLAGLKSLEHLRLEHTSVEGPGLSHLAQLPALESLVLDDSPVTDAGLAQVRGFKSLRLLRLIRTRVTREGARPLRAVLPDCTIKLRVGETRQ